MARMVCILDSKSYIRIGIFRESVAIGIFKSREDGVCINTDCLCSFFTVSFMVSSADGNAVGVVGKNNDECIIAPFQAPIAGIFNGLIKFDGIISCSLPVHDVELFIDRSTFNHGKKSVFVFG